jgi:hypothetical protein
MNYLITPRYSINKRGGKQQPSSKQPPAIIQIKENLVMSTLFTAVSVEQQEIVAGGGSALLNETFISALRNVQAGYSRSTLNGSETGSQQAVEKINSAGRQIGLADFATVVLPPQVFTPVV